MIVIGGGSGFIGSALSKRLQAKGKKVVNISRKHDKENLSWDQIKAEGLPACEAVVQISGANIGESRWTDARKKEIWDSRVETTKILVDAINKSDKPPKVFVSGSAIGYYPTHPMSTYDEYYTGKHAENFGGKLCAAWEETSSKLRSDTRRVVVRTGVVLGANGGALQQLLPLYKYGLGGVMGSGEQYFPWVHIDDIARLFEFAIENEKVEGVLNGVAPEPVRYSEFNEAMSRAVHRPAWFWVPSTVANVMFGERACLFLEGSKIVSKRTEELGFNFEHKYIEEALKDVVEKK